MTRRRSRLIFVVALLIGSGAVADEDLRLRNDPFKAPPLGFSGSGGLVSTSILPVVRAVMISGDYRSANVNGKVVMEGDVIDAYTVVEIMEGLVVFKKNEVEYQIPVYAGDSARGLR